jgi:hypothetical protein
MRFEEQIAMRRERGRAEQIKIRTHPPGRQIWGDYEILSASGNGYRVAMRGPGLFQNFCSCPDFAVNTLGTCKHVEALLGRLRESHPTLDSMAYRRTRPSLSLHYGDAVQVRLRLPARPPTPLADLMHRYCDPAGLLRPGFYPRFDEFVQGLRAADASAMIYADVLEFIDRENDVAAGLELERQLLDDNPHTSPLERAAIFAACRGRVILAETDESVRRAWAVAAAELLRRLRGISRILVISPAGARAAWNTALAPSGLPAAVASYEGVRKDSAALADGGVDLVILDHASRIHNRDGATARAVKHVRSRYAIALADPSLLDRPAELYSAVEFIDPRRLGPAFRFFEKQRSGADVARRLDSILFLDREK